MFRERPRCGRSGTRPSEVAPRTGEHSLSISAVLGVKSAPNESASGRQQRPRPARAKKTPPNAPKKLRANPARPTPNAEPRRKTPPARQRSKRHPTDARTGAVSRGCFPARRGYLMRRSPRATQTPPNGQTKRPPGRTTAKAGRTGRGNGRQRSRADPASRTPPNGRTSEGRGPAKPKKRARKTKRGTPGERPPPNYRFAGTRQTGRRPLLPDGRGYCGSLFCG